MLATLYLTMNSNAKVTQGPHTTLTIGKLVQVDKALAFDPPVKHWKLQNKLPAFTKYYYQWHAFIIEMDIHSTVATLVKWVCSVTLGGSLFYRISRFLLELKAQDGLTMNHYKPGIDNIDIILRYFNVPI